MKAHLWAVEWWNSEGKQWEVCFDEDTKRAEVFISRSRARDEKESWQSSDQKSKYRVRKVE